MSKLEKDIEACLVVTIRRRGGLCLKFVSPGNSGVPDRLCILPGGRVFFVELKRPKGGRVAPLQRWWQTKLSELGIPSFFCFDKDGVGAILEAMERKERGLYG